MRRNEKETYQGGREEVGSGKIKNETARRQSQKTNGKKNTAAGEPRSVGGAQMTGRGD